MRRTQYRTTPSGGGARGGRRASDNRNPEGDLLSRIVSYNSQSADSTSTYCDPYLSSEHSYGRNSYAIPQPTYAERADYTERAIEWGNRANVVRRTRVLDPETGTVQPMVAGVRDGSSLAQLGVTVDPRPKTSHLPPKARVARDKHYDRLQNKVAATLTHTTTTGIDELLGDLVGSSDEGGRTATTDAAPADTLQPEPRRSRRAKPATEQSASSIAVGSSMRGINTDIAHKLLLHIDYVRYIWLQWEGHLQCAECHMAPPTVTFGQVFRTLQLQGATVHRHTLRAQNDVTHICLMIKFNDYTDEQQQAVARFTDPSTLSLKDMRSVADDFLRIDAEWVCVDATPPANDEPMRTDVRDVRLAACSVRLHKFQFFWAST